MLSSFSLKKRYVIYSKSYETQVRLQNMVQHVFDKMWIDYFKAVFVIHLLKFQSMFKGMFFYTSLYHIGSELGWKDSK